LKLFAAPEAGMDALNLKKLNGNTPYVIMFGPDKCEDDQVLLLQ
jgi:hypothetical protein